MSAHANPTASNSQSAESVRARLRLGGKRFSGDDRSQVRERFPFPTIEMRLGWLPIIGPNLVTQPASASLISLIASAGHATCSQDFAPLIERSAPNASRAEAPAGRLAWRLAQARRVHGPPNRPLVTAVKCASARSQSAPRRTRRPLSQCS